MFIGLAVVGQAIMWNGVFTDMGASLNMVSIDSDCTIGRAVTVSNIGNYLNGCSNDRYSKTPLVSDDDPMPRGKERPETICNPDS